MNNLFPTQNPVFDYRALRLLMGLIAFAMPIMAVINSSTPISSISESYFTENRDYYVGLSYVIAALLWAYNGHNSTQKRISKVASIAAVFTAIFPTSCPTCQPDSISTIHYIAAVVLFITIVYFCLFAFRESARDKIGKEAGRRETIYTLCGWIIVISLLVGGISHFTLSDATRKDLAITYYVEFISLWAFGAAWTVAGKAIPMLAHKDERLKLSLK